MLVRHAGAFAISPGDPTLETIMIGTSRTVDATVTGPAAGGAGGHELNVRGLTRWLVMAVATVVVASYSTFLSLALAGIGRADLPVVMEQLPKVTKFLIKFDLGGEQTVAAWLSSALLLLCALVLVQIAATARRLGQAYAFHWLILGFIFVGLSMDESVGFHEMTIKPLHAALATEGIFLYAWVIPALAFVGAVGLAYLGFLLHLERAVRLRIVLAGGLFVGGAVGFEMLEGLLVDFYAAHPLIYETALHLEDTLEFAGTLLFLHTLLGYVTRHAPHFSLRSG